MKKLLLFGMLCSLGIVSCKKNSSSGDSQPETGNKTYKVDFKVADFTQQTGPVVTTNAVNSNKKTTAVQDNITTLYYLIFDSNNKLVHQTTQKSSVTGFGSISDSLMVGTYTVVFIGGAPTVPTNGNGAIVDLLLLENPTTTHTLSDYYASYTASNYTSPGSIAPWSDTFFKSYQLQVSASTTTQNVTLNRIVGKVSVHVKDLPTEATTLRLMVINDKRKFYLDQNKPDETGSSTIIHTLTAAEKTDQNFKISDFVLNTGAPLTVTITCYNQSGSVLASKAITNVVLTANQETLFSGSLFGNGAGSGYNVTTPDWDPSTINISF
ncbi:FimB/Mfa2 family fimbrial subunit [Mucilaginibacter lacusdianchii]|uniref:FimB/Mfa2 family fimbrial subunit n=1 Tax=Mucilaginibacter lacusdianchii TaxID=2684211 RepID=UPI00131ABE4C|nr:FimB/Mfa2 family fimbrial subunit [Mucilaginibacter sp. JXJ CY 39]